MIENVGQNILPNFLVFSLDMGLAKPIVEHLLAHDHRVVWCTHEEIEQQASAWLTGQQDAYPRKLSILLVDALDTPRLLERVVHLRPDVIVSAIYDKKIPEAVLGCANLGAFNIHPGPLPEYAGANVWGLPIRDQLSTTALTLHQMTGAIDAGSVCERVFVHLDARETYVSIGHKLRGVCDQLWSKFYSRLMLDPRGYMNRLERAQLPMYHGPFCHRDIWIDFRERVARIDALIRSLPDTTPALCFFNGMPLSILDAMPAIGSSADQAPGSLVIVRSDAQVTVNVATGDYYLTLRVVSSHLMGVMSGQTWVERLGLDANEHYRLRSGFELEALAALAGQVL